MKTILIVILLLITFRGLNQTSDYMYSVKFLKCCNEPTHHDPEWKLKGLNGEIYSPEKNQLSIPDTGRYFFISSTYDNLPISIHINQKKQIDTVYLKCLSIEHSDQILTEDADQTDPVYITCSGKVDSIYKEFFSDGQLRIIGNFSKGVLIDSLVEYYYSGLVKSKVLKKKTTYEHWYFFPNGKIEKRFRYDLKKENKYQLYEYDIHGKIKTQIDYSKKYGFRYYETGTIKTTTLGRRFENYFIVNDTIRYQCKNGLETTFYSNGFKHFEFSSKPLHWKDRLYSKSKKVRKEYKLSVYSEEQNNEETQIVKFWTDEDLTIYNGGLSKLDIADAFSITIVKNGKNSITIYPIVYEGESEKEVVLYEVYNWSQQNDFFQKLKPEELNTYLSERNLKIKSW